MLNSGLVNFEASKIADLSAQCLTQIFPSWTTLSDQEREKKRERERERRAVESKFERSPPRVSQIVAPTLVS